MPQTMLPQPKPSQTYWQSLRDPHYAPTALRVALMIGTLLFVINHGAALWQGQMTRQRWISAALTYIVPYGVSVHGQHSRSSRQQP